MRVETKLCANWVPTLKIFNLPRFICFLFYLVEEGWCQVVEEFSAEQSLKTLGGRDFSSIKTLIVPEGYQVTLYAQNTISSNRQLGPIFGRMVVTKFCDSDWDEILVKKSDSSAAHYPIVCDEAGFGGYCQQLGKPFVDEKTELDSLEGQYPAADTQHSFDVHLTSITSI